MIACGTFVSQAFFVMYVGDYRYGVMVLPFQRQKEVEVVTPNLCTNIINFAKTVCNSDYFYNFVPCLFILYRKIIKGEKLWKRKEL